MPCFRPLTAWQPLDGGQVAFRELKDHRELQLPCGQCIGCKLQRQQMWSFRCLAEAALHEHNWFLTLTYDDEHLPLHGALVHRHWQLFAKRVRKALGPFRYLMCGEYGERTGRPHYHALCFGLALPDALPYSVRREHPVFRSRSIERLWGKGLCELGTVTASSARYCAGYVLKPSAAPELLDPHTGEVITVPKAYGRMSLRPGLGDGWIRRYYPEVFTHGVCYSKDKPFAIPKRFRHILEEIDVDTFEELKARAVEKARSSPHTTRARLATRESLALRKLSNYSEVRPHAI